jgi:hypothetical protein
MERPGNCGPISRRALLLRSPAHLHGVRLTRSAMAVANLPTQQARSSGRTFATW